MTIKFGTDGIRGPVESKITPEVCLRIGHAAGVVLKEMGWEPDSLIQHWLSRNAEQIAPDYWTKETKIDWKWALGISLLSLIIGPLNCDAVIIPVA